MMFPHDRTNTSLLLAQISDYTDPLLINWLVTGLVHSHFSSS